MSDTCLHIRTFHNSTTKPAQFQVEILKNNFVKWNCVRKNTELFICKFIRKKKPDQKKEMRKKRAARKRRISVFPESCFERISDNRFDYHFDCHLY